MRRNTSANIYRRLKVNKKILSPAALNLQVFFTCLSSLQSAIRVLTDYPAPIDHHNLLKGLFYKIIVLFSMIMAITYFYTGLYITSKYLWRARNRHTIPKYIPDPFSEIPETNKEEQNIQPLTNSTKNEN
jgi:hypothetical protein